MPSESTTPETPPSAPPPSAPAHCATATTEATPTSPPALPARGLDPRGAKARTTGGNPCQAPAMKTGRCRRRNRPSEDAIERTRQAIIERVWVRSIGQLAVGN